MPGTPSLTAQQEAFCQALLTHDSAADAYRFAFPKSKLWKPGSLYANASALQRKPQVKARIAELRNVSAAPSVISTQWVMVELASTYAEARRRGALGVATKCLELAGRSLGMFVDRLRIEQGEVEAARARIRQFAAESGIMLTPEDEDAAVDEAVRLAIGGARAANALSS